MNRRDFIAASAVAGMTPLTSAVAAEPGGQDGRQYLELRHYRLLYGQRQRQVSDFLSKAAIPAWNRAGIGPVGVFNVVFGPNSPSIYVLLPHPNIESVATARARLAADAEFQRAGAAFLEAPLADPAFVRVDSSLMRAFQTMPRVEVPAGAAGNQPRMFELRTYESHSDPAAIRKMEMFDRGEIEIFRKTGLTPVFFGETIVGPNMPNLTYMLTFENMAQRDAAWDDFRVHPDWRAMASDPYYADTTSAISGIILRPTGYSQI